MDVFGPQWKDHREKIIQHWKETIGTDDTIILCGDTSWFMDLSDACLLYTSRFDRARQREILRRQDIETKEKCHMASRYRKKMGQSAGRKDLE